MEIKAKLSFTIGILLLVYGIALGEEDMTPPDFKYLNELTAGLEIKVKSGKEKIYFPDNSLRAEGGVKNHDMTGQWSFYSKKNGKTFLKCTGTFKKGMKHGRFTIFFPNGKKHQIAYYRNDMLNGPVTKFSTRGIPRYHIFYKNNKKHGIYREYFPDGKPKEFSQYNNGIKDGPENKYSPNGKRISMGKYSNGKKNGLWQYKYDNGRIKAKGYFKDDKKVSKWKYYDEDRNIIEN